MDDRKEVQRRLIWLYISGFLDLFAVSLFLPTLTNHARTLGASGTLLGVLGSSYGAIQLFSSPSIGHWSDRAGRKKVLLVCCLATSFTYFLLGQASSVSSLGLVYVLLFLFLSRILAGVFKHSQTLTKAVMAEMIPGDKAEAFGRFNASSSLGFIIGPVVGGHLGDVPHGFTIICSLAAAIFLLNAFLLYVILDNDPVKKKMKDEDIPLAESWSLKSRPQWWRELEEKKEVVWGMWDVMSLRFLLSLSSLMFRSSFSLLLEDYYSLSKKEIGYMISFQGVVGTICGFQMGWILNLFSGNPYRMLFYGSLGQSISLMGLAYSPSLVLVVVSLIPFCICNTVLRVAGSDVTVQRSPQDALGAMVGLGQSVASIARMTSPLAAGASLELATWAPATISLLCSASGSLLAWRMLRDTGKPKVD